MILNSEQSKRINLQNIQIAHEAKYIYIYIYIKKPIKNVQRSKCTFLQRRHTDGQKAHE